MRSAVLRGGLALGLSKIPVLETYRQMAIRRQKAKDWQQAIWWVERGLALYCEQAARPESVDDLRKRLSAYQAKLTTPTKPTEGGAESARRARQPDDRGPRVRDLRREHRPCSRPWPEAEELPRLPPADVTATVLVGRSSRIPAGERDAVDGAR
jgi:hypothetical protein